MDRPAQKLGNKSVINFIISYYCIAILIYYILGLMILVFSKVNLKSMHVMEALDTFSHFSGLEVNSEKTVFFTLN